MATADSKAATISRRGFMTEPLPRTFYNFFEIQYLSESSGRNLMSQQIEDIERKMEAAVEKKLQEIVGRVDVTKLGRT